MAASPITFDLMAYIHALDDALQATLTDAAKFDRLAVRLGASTSNAKIELRNRFASEAERAHEYRTRTLVYARGLGSRTYRRRRFDRQSRGSHSNQVFPRIGLLPLLRPSLPSSGTAPQGSWTQWRGVAARPDPAQLTETMGVFMPMDLRSKTPEQGLFDSNAAILNLQKIENALRSLGTSEMAGRSLWKD